MIKVCIRIVHQVRNDFLQPLVFFFKCLHFRKLRPTQTTKFLPPIIIGFVRNLGLATSAQNIQAIVQTNVNLARYLQRILIRIPFPCHFPQLPWSTNTGTVVGGKDKSFTNQRYKPFAASGLQLSPRMRDKFNMWALMLQLHIIPHKT